MSTERDEELERLRMRVEELERSERDLRARLHGTAGKGTSPPGRLLKAMWRGLPVPWHWRLRFKAWLFALFAPLLRHTNAYRRWEAAGGGSGRWPRLGKSRLTAAPTVRSTLPVPMAPTQVDPE
jgi:hypothetical protein